MLDAISDYFYEKLNQTLNLQCLSMYLPPHLTRNNDLFKMYVLFTCSCHKINITSRSEAPSKCETFISWVSEIS